MEFYRIIFSKEEREMLSNFDSNIPTKDIVNNYTLTLEELNLLKKFKSNHNKLGYILQLKVLKHKGWSINKSTFIPISILNYVSDQIKVNSTSLDKYWKREANKYEHFSEIKKELNYIDFTEEHSNIFFNTLLVCAKKDDDLFHLFDIFQAKCKEQKIVLPKITKIEKIIRDVLIKTEEYNYKNISNQLSLLQKEKIDNLLNINENETIAKITWLRDYKGKVTPDEAVGTLEKIELIIDLKLKINIEEIAISKVEKLVKLGKRYQPFSFKRFEEDKRYSILAIFLIHLEEILYDRAIKMHDILIYNSMKQSTASLSKDAKTKEKSKNELVEKFFKFGQIIINAKQENKDIDEVIEKKIKWEEFKKDIYLAGEVLNKTEHEMLEYFNKRYSYLRKYTPKLLKIIKFKSNVKSSEQLIEAIDLINNLNDSNKKTLPDEVVLDFTTNKSWKKIINNEENKYLKKHYYELAVYAEIKNKTRSGDIYVSESKEFNKFDSYLISEEEWEKEKQQFKLSAPLQAKEYLQKKYDELKELLKWYENNKEVLDEITDEDGNIHIKKYKNETPEEAKILSDTLYQYLPRINLTDLLMEVAKLTDFHKHFFHASDNSSINNDNELRVLIATIMSIGTNIDFVQAENSFPGISYKQLARTSEWRIYEENIANAQAEIVNHQILESISSHWGDGTTSSSDGTGISTSVKSMSSGKNPHYSLDNVIRIIRFINDKYALFYTDVANPYTREGVGVIDGLIRHNTKIQIKEHYTDTAGYTHQIFALMDLMGFSFAPRIRNIPDIKLYCPKELKENSILKDVIKGNLNTSLIEENYDQILRLANSIFTKKVESSLILPKLGSYARKNTLAKAMSEMGKLVKTIFILKYASQPGLQKRVQNGLNKGEGMNGLGRDVFFGKRGQFWEHELQKQLQKASCLTLVLNSIVLWNTKYLNKTVKYFKENNISFDESLLAHVSPLNRAHINFLGRYNFDDLQELENDNLRKLNIKKD